MSEDTNRDREPADLLRIIKSLTEVSWRRRKRKPAAASHDHDQSARQGSQKKAGSQ